MRMSILSIFNVVFQLSKLLFYWGDIFAGEVPQLSEVI